MYELGRKSKRMLEITCRLFVVELLAAMASISLAELLIQQLIVHWSIPRTSSVPCLDYKTLLCKGYAP